MPDVSKNLLYEIERHCNNYFNDRNDPDNPQRDYPPAFLELAFKIQQYADYPYRYTGNGRDWGEYRTWQSFFASDLATYKRVRFL